MKYDKVSFPCCFYQTQTTKLFHSSFQQHPNSGSVVLVRHIPSKLTVPLHNSTMNIRRNMVRVVSTVASATMIVKLFTNTRNMCNAWITHRSVPIRVHERARVNVYYHSLLKSFRQSTTHYFGSNNEQQKLAYSFTTVTSTTVRSTTTATAAAIDGEEMLSKLDPENSEDEKFKSNDSKEEQETNDPAYSETIAEGVVVAQFPGGFTAIKIFEEFTTDAEFKKQRTIQLTTDGLKVPDAATTVKIEVGDYQGKRVDFENGDVGYVVVHRPPLVYVFRDGKKAISQGDGMIDNINNNQNVKIKDAVATVDILSELSYVVDCFGRPIIDVLKNNNNSDGAGFINETFPEVFMKQELQPPKQRSVFSPIPQVKDIALINTPMLTGITMIDTLASIGRGQNMLLIGHDNQMMQDVSIDMFQTQLRIAKNNGNKLKCVYAATVEPAQDVLSRFQKAGIDGGVQIVASRKDPTPMNNISKKNDEASESAEAVFIAATACAIGESYALDDGYHSLVVIDTIDHHKKLWDYTTRVMVDEFGIDAVVKSDRDGGASSEMRGFFSSLIQRSAQYKLNRNGGSVTLLLLVSIPKEATADSDDTLYTLDDFKDSPIKTKTRIELLVQKNIPLTAEVLRKINVPIPSVSEGQRRFVLQHVDDLISMSDGQIWLDERLERMGRQPPVDPQRSITRIGIGADTLSRADAPAFRRIVEGLRLELAQATDAMMVVVPTSAENNNTTNNDPTKQRSTTIAQNRRQFAIQLALHQCPGSGGRQLSESCIVLLAAQKGYLDNAVENGAVAGTKEGTRVISDLLQSMTNNNEENTTIRNVLASIDSTMDITESEQEILTNAIRDFFLKQ